MRGIVDFALWSASRATDNIYHVWYGKDEERWRTEITREIRRHAAGLEAIAAAARRNPHLNHGVPRISSQRCAPNPTGQHPISNPGLDQARPAGANTS